MDWSIRRKICVKNSTQNFFIVLILSPITLSCSFISGMRQREFKYRTLTAKCKSLLHYLSSKKSRDSSVGIELGYRLGDRGSRVWFPAGAGNFSLHHRVQNGSGVHPPSGRSVKLTTHLHLVPRSMNAGSYTSTPPLRLRGMLLT
jgi:hypothetical protein